MYSVVLCPIGRHDAHVLGLAALVGEVSEDQLCQRDIKLSMILVRARLPRLLWMVRQSERLATCIVEHHPVRGLQSKSGPVRMWVAIFVQSLQQQ